MTHTTLQVSPANKRVPSQTTPRDHSKSRLQTNTHRLLHLRDARLALPRFDPRAASQPPPQSQVERKPERLGESVAAQLLADGAAAILRELADAEGRDAG